MLRIFKRAIIVLQLVGLYMMLDRTVTLCIVSIDPLKLKEIFFINYGLILYELQHLYMKKIKLTYNHGSGSIAFINYNRIQTKISG